MLKVPCFETNPFVRETSGHSGLPNSSRLLKIFLSSEQPPGVSMTHMGIWVWVKLWTAVHVSIY